MMVYETLLFRPRGIQFLPGFKRLRGFRKAPIATQKRSIDHIIALTSTCRIVYTEARGIVYSVNTMHVEIPENPALIYYSQLLPLTYYSQLLLPRFGPLRVNSLRFVKHLQISIRDGNMSADYEDGCRYPSCNMLEFLLELLRNTCLTSLAVRGDAWEEFLCDKASTFHYRPFKLDWRDLAVSQCMLWTLLLRRPHIIHDDFTQDILRNLDILSAAKGCVIVASVLRKPQNMKGLRWGDLSAVIDFLHTSTVKRLGRISWNDRPKHLDFLTYGVDELSRKVVPKLDAIRKNSERRHSQTGESGHLEKKGK